MKIDKDHPFEVVVKKLREIALENQRLLKRAAGVRERKRIKRRRAYARFLKRLKLKRADRQSTRSVVRGRKTRNDLGV